MKLSYVLPCILMLVIYDLIHSRLGQRMKTIKLIREIQHEQSVLDPCKLKVCLQLYDIFILPNEI